MNVFHSQIQSVPPSHSYNNKLYHNWPGCSSAASEHIHWMPTYIQHTYHNSTAIYINIMDTHVHRCLYTHTHPQSSMAAHDKTITIYTYMYMAGPISDL